MTPVTQMPARDASRLPAVYFSRELPPGGGSAGGGKRPLGKPAGKPKPVGKPKPKKTGGAKTSKKRK